MKGAVTWCLSWALNPLQTNQNCPLKGWGVGVFVTAKSQLEECFPQGHVEHCYAESWSWRFFGKTIKLWFRNRWFIHYGMPLCTIHFSFQAAQKGLEQAIEAARVPDLLEALGVAEGHGSGVRMRSGWVSVVLNHEVERQFRTMCTFFSGCLQKLEFLNFMHFGLNEMI